MEIPQIINKLREDTPGCGRLIHFNNAGCSLSPTPVTSSVVEHLKLEQQEGGYEAAEQATEKTDNFYQAFARLLKCRPQEIAYVENATRAWDMAFYSIPFQQGDQVITGQVEYASNFLAMLQLQKRFGIEIVVIPNDVSGVICLDTLRQRISSKTRLITLTHVPSQIGTPQPATEVGQIAHDHGILYLLDACQSAGQIPLDTQALHCDFLTGTGRKYLRGPRGTGFLFVNQEILNQLDPPFVDLHSAHWVKDNEFRFESNARRFENWESFVAGKIGLGRAVDYACDLGLDRIQDYIRQIAGELVERLKELGNVAVHENSDNLSGIITFTKLDEDAVTLQRRMRNTGINTSVSKRANAILDTGLRGVGDVNRASLHYYNTSAEIERFVAELCS